MFLVLFMPLLDSARNGFEVVWSGVASLASLPMSFTLSNSNSSLVIFFIAFLACTKANYFFYVFISFSRKAVASWSL